MTGMSTSSIIVHRIKKFVDISAVNVFLSIVVYLCWLHWIFPEHPAEVIVRCSASLRGCQRFLILGVPLYVANSLKMTLARLAGTMLYDRPAMYCGQCFTRLT